MYRFRKIAQHLCTGVGVVFGLLVISQRPMEYSAFEQIGLLIGFVFFSGIALAIFLQEEEARFSGGS